MTLSYQALRHSARRLRRSPAFTLAVVGCLSLGLTVNASVLTLLNAVVLRPLPYPNADELLFLSFANRNIATLPVPGTAYRAWLEQNHSLAATMTIGLSRATVGVNGAAEDITGASVSTSLPKVLGVQPMLGRFLNADDERLGADGSVVLGHALWSRLFNSDSTIVGRTIRLTDRMVTVAGVMPAGFDFPKGAEFWRADVTASAAPGSYYTIIARRRREFSIAGVQQDLTRIPYTFAGDIPRNFVDARPSAMPMHDWLFGDATPAMLMLFAAATLLLVIGGAGVANLVLAQTASRTTEFALRRALGATVTAVVAPVVMECMMLATVAGVVGLALSVWVTRLFVHLGPPILSEVHNIALDWRVVAVTVLCTMLTGAIIALGAALQAARQSAFGTNALKGRVARHGKSSGATRRVLVVVQIAVAMVLVSGASLLATSLVRVKNVPLGFEAEHTTLASIRLPRSTYASNASARRLYDALRLDLSTAPGVLGVTYGTPPLNGSRMMVESPPDAGGHYYTVATDDVGPDYFATYRIPILSGRGISAMDDEGSDPVAVINQSAKNLIFPTRSPLGERLTALTIRGQHPRVIGVSANVPQYDVAMQTQAEVFAATAQTDERPMELAVRASGDPAALVKTIRRVLSKHDPQLVGRYSLLNELVQKSIAPRLFTATLSSAFAALALVIATIGLVGLLSFIGAQRANEMGIRVALGAQRKDIVRLMLGEGMTLVVFGLLIGTTLALALSGLLASLIFQLQPSDPGVLLSAATLVGGVAFAATLAPTLRASRVDPMRALRQE